VIGLRTGPRWHPILMGQGTDLMLIVLEPYRLEKVSLTCKNAHIALVSWGGLRLKVSAEHGRNIHARKVSIPSRDTSAKLFV
jgi:hypothetical protein